MLSVPFQTADTAVLLVDSLWLLATLVMGSSSAGDNDFVHYPNLDIRMLALGAALTGICELGDDEIYTWAQDHVQVPVCSHTWQTHLMHRPHHVNFFRVTCPKVACMRQYPMHNCRHMLLATHSAPLHTKTGMMNISVCHGLVD